MKRRGGALNACDYVEEARLKDCMLEDSNSPAFWKRKTVELIKRLLVGWDVAQWQRDCLSCKGHGFDH
jgi:hypothetical protein